MIPCPNCAAVPVVDVREPVADSTSVVVVARCLACGWTMIGADLGMAECVGGPDRHMVITTERKPGGIDFRPDERVTLSLPRP